MILYIQDPIDLSRYDLSRPPTSWNSKFQSTETEYANFSNKGPKNTEELYFLFDNIETTKAVAKIACHKKQQNEYWISKTTTQSPIKILDFSSCKCLHDILEIIDSLRIDIYNSKLIINGFENIEIESLKNHNRNTRILEKYPELFEVSWFGQLLTDYQNGKIFKKLLVESGLEIDGYRWCENINPYGLTYCFFQSHILKNSIQLQTRID